MISPLPNTPMQNAMQNVQGDVSNAIEFTPAGQFMKRVLFALRGVQPSPQDTVGSFPGAVRVASSVVTPGAVGTGAAIGAAIKAIQNATQMQNPSQDIGASAIEGARTAALLAPLGYLAQNVNAPALRPVDNGMGNTNYRTQTLLQNIIDNIKQKMTIPPKTAR